MSALKGTQKQFKAALRKVITDAGYPEDSVSVKFFNNPFALNVECKHYMCYTLRNIVTDFIARDYGYLEIDQYWSYNCTASVSYK